MSERSGSGGQPGGGAAAGGVGGAPASRPRRWTGPGAADLGLPERVPCPFCDGTDSELYCAFGSVLSVVTYWCNGCHTAFEWIKRDA